MTYQVTIRKFLYDRCRLGFQCARYKFDVLDPTEIQQSHRNVFDTNRLFFQIAGSCFTKFDEDLTRAFAIYCGVSIFHVSFRRSVLQLSCLMVVRFPIDFKRKPMQNKNSEQTRKQAMNNK